MVCSATQFSLSNTSPMYSESRPWHQCTYTCSQKNKKNETRTMENISEKTNHCGDKKTEANTPRTPHHEITIKKHNMKRKAIINRNPNDEKYHTNVMTNLGNKRRSKLTHPEPTKNGNSTYTNTHPTQHTGVAETATFCLKPLVTATQHTALSVL